MATGKEENTEAFPSGGDTAVVRTEGTFAGWAGLPLYYQRWTPRGRSPRAGLALVHGFGEHGGRYANVVNYFVPRGYAVHALDIRGHGRSPGARGHVDDWNEFREDVRAFLDVVGADGPQPVFLYGHSMGGLIVLEYALSASSLPGQGAFAGHPNGPAGVIATSPLLTTPAVSPFLLFLARILSRLWPAFSMNSRLDISTLSRDPAMLAEFEQARSGDERSAQEVLVHGRASARLSTEINGAILRTQTGAADWRLPLLIVHGADDRLVPPTGSRDFFEHVRWPDKEHHEYPGGYHELHNDVNREEVLADIERWIDRHLSPA